jgi:hypothetical protein
VVFRSPNCARSSPRTPTSIVSGRGVVKSCPCIGFAFIPISLCSARVSGPRRSARPKVSVRCQPARPRVFCAHVGPVFAVICARRANSEGRRPSVKRWCGVRRPAHNERFLGAQQELTSVNGCPGPFKPNFSPRHNGSGTLTEAKRTPPRRIDQVVCDGELCRDWSRNSPIH